MINWKYIKGLNENNGADALYTFINFKCFTANDTFACMPSIFYSFINDPAGGSTVDFDAGHIITQRAINQHIDTLFTFTESVNIYQHLQFVNTEGSTEWHVIAAQTPVVTRIPSLYVQYNSGTETDPTWDNIAQFFGPTSTEQYPQSYFWSGVTIRARNNQAHLAVGNVNNQITVKLDGIEGKCEAKYFNATSDRRAKDELTIMNFKALDLVNHTNLYSFRYKDTDTKSIGIIAQDVLDVDINGFKLVDNENASGQDMDYMSIHESKIVYILWKAIQEQQKEIEELKSKIKDLK